MQLIDETTGEPLNVSGTNKVVKMRFRARGSATSLFDTVALTKEDSGVLGWVIWYPTASQTDQDTGRYEGQLWIADAGDSSVQTALAPVKFKIVEKFAAP